MEATELVARKQEFIGRDIESHEDTVYRGPIQDIFITDEEFPVLVLRLKWAARLDMKKGWKISPVTDLRIFAKAITFNELGDGRWAAYSFLGPVIIMSNDDENMEAPNGQ